MDTTSRKPRSKKSALDSSARSLARRAAWVGACLLSGCFGVVPAEDPTQSSPLYSATTKPRLGGTAPAEQGEVVLRSDEGVDTAAWHSSASARFTVGNGSCSESTVSACRIRSCAVDSPRSSALASAGVIVVAGGAQPVTLAPQSDGRYGVDLNRRQPLWSEGATLLVSAAGDEAPAFAVPVAAPSRLTVTAPAWPATLPIERTNGLELFFDSASRADRVHVVLSQSTTTRALSIECTFHASEGVGRIPSQAMASLVPGAASLDVASLEVADVSSEGWSIRVSTEMSATTPDGSPFGGDVVIE